VLSHNKSALGACCYVFAVAIVFVGRCQTFDMTEGQALIHGRWYWGVATLVAFLGSYCFASYEPPRS